MISSTYSSNNRSSHFQEARRQQILWQSCSALMVCATASVCYLVFLRHSYKLIKQEGLLDSVIKRGEKTKLKVIEWAQEKYPKDFIVEYTRHGNPKPGTDDKADSIIIANAGLKTI